MKWQRVSDVCNVRQRPRALPVAMRDMAECERNSVELTDLLHALDVGGEGKDVSLMTANLPA